MNHQIALIRLTATLHLADPNSPASRIGTNASLNLMENMPCRSVPGGSSSHTPVLYFDLTHEQIQALERARHDGPTGRFSLYLRFQGTLAWLRHTGNSQGISPGEVSTIGEDGWSPSAGMFSEMRLFWNTTIPDLRIEVEPSVWVDNVLPGLGYDTVRLVEIHLDGMPEKGIFLAQFDKARHKYEMRDYEGCIQDCRGIQNAWEKALGASRNKVIAKVLSDRLGWPETDWHFRMLDSIWKGYADMVNAPHHPEGTPAAPTQADASFCLLLTAILAEYVGDLLQVKPL
jgi:hypothetical protein